MIELVMELEAELGFFIPEDELQRVRTIGDLIRLIREHERRGDSEE